MIHEYGYGFCGIFFRVCVRISQRPGHGVRRIASPVFKTFINLISARKQIVAKAGQNDGHKQDLDYFYFAQGHLVPQWVLVIVATAYGICQMRIVTNKTENIET